MFCRHYNKQHVDLASQNIIPKEEKEQITSESYTEFTLGWAKIKCSNVMIRKDHHQKLK